jgi:uncharacterized membrane protein
MNSLGKILNVSAIIVLSIMMLFGAFNHVTNPGFYNGFIPDIFPKLIVNYFSALVELIIGLLILIPRTRRVGVLCFCGLMVAFIPIHIWDLLKDIPAIGSKQAAVVRLAFQLVLIGSGLLIYKKSANKSKIS